MANSIAFHYDIDDTNSYAISCGRLTKNLLDNLRDVIAPAAADINDEQAEESASGDESVNSDDSADEDIEAAAIVDEADPAFLGDQAMWASAQLLRWTLSSDRVITATDLAALQRSDPARFKQARNACCALTNALKRVYPIAAGETTNTVLQLTALGYDMATTACQSQDLMIFVKTELQTLDLEAYFLASMRQK